MTSDDLKNLSLEQQAALLPGGVVENGEVIMTAPKRGTVVVVDAHTFRQVLRAFIAEKPTQLLELHATMKLAILGQPNEVSHLISQYNEAVHKGSLPSKEAIPLAFEALQEVVDAADGAGWNQLDPTLLKARQALDLKNGKFIQHKGMTISGDGAAELGKLMQEQRKSKIGVYPDQL